MYCCVATGGPTRSHRQKRTVIDFTDQNLSRVKLHLRMASQTKLRVSLNEHFVVDGSVRLMARCASVLHPFVDKHKGARLFAMTLRTLLVLPSKAESACLFENVSPMGIMAVDAVHLSFKDGVVLRKAKLRMFLLMAVQARLRVSAGVVDKDRFATPSLYVLATRSVARFTTAYFVKVCFFLEEPRMNAAGKLSRDFCVAVFTLLVAHIVSTLDLGRNDHRTGYRGAGRSQKENACCGAGSHERKRDPIAKS